MKTDNFRHHRIALYFPLGLEQMDDYCCAALDRDGDIPEDGGEFESAGNRFISAAEKEGRVWYGERSLSGSPHDDAPCVMFVTVNSSTEVLVEPTQMAAYPGVRMLPGQFVSGELSALMAGATS